jgi:hypothetical protein
VRARTHVVGQTGQGGTQVGALGEPEVPDGHLANFGDADFDVVVLERDWDIG